jgi:hypothetical protein
MKTKSLSVLFLLAVHLQAQDLSAVLSRLDKLEAENRELRQEVKSLRELVAGAKPAPTIPERLDIVEARVSEQAATKVETPGRFPFSLSGTAVFQAFYNTRGANGVDVPLQASQTLGRASSGATVRQSVLGLRYHGPQTFAGGKVSGSMFMDFWDGTTENPNSPFRVRTADITIDWASRSLSFGLMKPLISPHDPTSLAIIGVSPLTSSGNLWRWQPQVRFEQRAAWFKAQAAVMQTNEESTTANAALLNSRRRPALELRASANKSFSEHRKVELGFSGHFSQSRALGFQIPSRIAAIDWLVQPAEKLILTGNFFNGSNVHHLGALRQSYAFRPGGRVEAVHSTGGWAQASVPFTQRLTLNAFAGIHDDRNRDLARGQNANNRTAGANLMFRLAPNVMLSFESLQIRSTYLDTLQRRINRYDLAIAYLF